MLCAVLPAATTLCVLLLCCCWHQCLKPARLTPSHALPTTAHVFPVVHVWNYRRFVVGECEKRNAAAQETARANGGEEAAKNAVLPFPKLLDSELQFTRDKINENFSNYS